MDDGFLTINYFHFTIFNENINTVYKKKIDDCSIDKYVISVLPSCFTRYFLPIQTPADGNCLWHMVSRCLCGNCGLTNILKDMTVITLFMLEQTFIEIMRLDIKTNNSKASDIELNSQAIQRFQRTVQIAKMPDQWGDEYHLLAISTFLATKICIYNFYNANFSENQLHSFFDETKTNESGFHLIYTPLKATMFSSFKNDLKVFGYYDPIIKHYTSLIPQMEQSIFIPKINLFKEFSEN